MSVSERLAELKTAKAKVCPVGRILNSLTDKDRNALIKDISDVKVPYRLIRTALNKEGFRIAIDSLIAHRKENCQCYWGQK